MTTKVARTRQLPSGAIEALSSNGKEIYHVSIGERVSCDCPAGRNGRNCYHVATAVQRYAARWPIPARYRKPVRKVCADDLYGPAL